MRKRLYPYVVFLPLKNKEKVLKGIFGSRVPIDILNFSISQGISKKIYQQELIGSFGYSNKTILEHLKTLTEIGILKEAMEKKESGERTVWVKFYLLSDLGRWFALLLSKEDALSGCEKIDVITSIFRTYVRWIRELTEKIGLKREALHDIFIEEMR